MINGKNVYLRMPELTDLEAIYELANIEENRDFLNMYRPLSKIEEESWIKDCTDKARIGEKYRFVVVDKKTNNVVGNCEIGHIDNIRRVAEIGITLNDKSQNKGFGPEALKLLLKYGFMTLNLNLIEIGAISSNDRAIHVYKDKLKFKEDARLRQRHYKNGKYYDDVILSMTREEYDKLYSSE
jgi:RimJ/RimL family protein N-acetyltransferase